MNIDPTIWGPNLWKSLHYITLGYPEYPNDMTKQSMKNLFMSLPYVLPCEKCRVNFSQHLTKYPLSDTTLSSRQKLIYWLVDIHNEINRSMGKPVLPYEKVMETYSKIPYEGFSSGIDMRVLTIILSVLFIIILLVVLRIRLGY